MGIEFQRAIARCPECHENGGMYIGLWPGLPCPKCGSELGHVEGDPSNPSEREEANGRTEADSGD